MNKVLKPCLEKQHQLLPVLYKPEWKTATGEDGVLIL